MKDIISEAMDLITRAMTEEEKDIKTEFIMDLGDAEVINSVSKN